jgi:CelD/BcsL family acetyltransferase involved in cellulose biosynthesis
MQYAGKSDRAIRVEVAESVEALAPHLEAWQQLAEAAADPYGLPGWQLAWWRHLAPPKAVLRVVLVFDASRLVAVAPFFAHRRSARRVDYRLLAARFAQPVGVVAAPGTEVRLAALIAPVLARAEPRPSLLAFEGMDARSPWPELIAQSWPGRVRPLPFRILSEGAPGVAVHAGGFGAWLEARSASFRQEMRRKHRRLERAGGAVHRATTPDQVRRALAAYVELHHERFARLGGSHFPRAGLRETLEQAAADLVAAAHLRIFTVEVDDEVVGVQVALAAGGVVSAWGVAFSSDHAQLSPGVLVVLAMVEDAHARGERYVDLGWGEGDAYKLRFADRGHERGVTFGGLVPAGVRAPLTRLEMLVLQAQGPARRAVDRLPPERRDAVKVLARRARRHARPAIR